MFVTLVDVTCYMSNFKLWIFRSASMLKKLKIEKCNSLASFRISIEQSKVRNNEIVYHEMIEKWKKWEDVIFHSFEAAQASHSDAFLESVSRKGEIIAKGLFRVPGYICDFDSCMSTCMGLYFMCTKFQKCVISCSDNFCS